ncbi:MAG: hypothetical protein IPH75_11715 [bacterium]|nr:hypothetical protein [bacterium]
MTSMALSCTSNQTMIAVGRHLKFRPTAVGGAILLVLSLALIPGLRAQSDPTGQRNPIIASAASPSYCITAHDLGKLYVGLTNFGRLSYGKEVFYYDCFTGGRIGECQYPKASTKIYLYNGGLWVGGVVGRDTLVSTSVEQNTFSREFHPDAYPYGLFQRRSTLGPTEEMLRDARSEQDLITTYQDTLTSGNAYPSFDQIEGRTHQPLGIEVRQESYMWSYGYADDLILFNLKITNISSQEINQLYAGVFMDPDVHRYVVDFGATLNFTPAKTQTGGRDDIIGFLKSYPVSNYNQCEFEDTVNIAWSADMDGDWLSSSGLQVPHVTGIRFLRQPRDDEQFSFNWWVPNVGTVFDFGPQYRTNYRNLGTGFGQPIGDRNRYFLMSNGEVDYSQVLTGRISVADPLWMPPSSSNARSISRGADGCYLMSLGPYSLGPREQVDIPFAFVGGESLHVDFINAYLNLRFGNYYPERYLQGLNMGPFATNAAWAARIYDNPGIDTDGDGYFGKLRVCVLDSSFVDGHWVATVVDSTYYEGDGVPDWRAESPPPPPVIWIEPIVGGVKVRFNGYRSEIYRDFLSGYVDFEGYHVYMGRDDREASLALAASYDFNNFDVFAYNPHKKPAPGYDLTGVPATVEEIRCRFSDAADPCNDTLFHPQDYGPTNPYRGARFIDSTLYFLPHDNNVSRFGIDTPIKKRYPDAVKPDADHPITPDMMTEDGYLKYYEYECEITGLLPTVPYYFSVTAFDFGSPKVGLQPLESARLLGLQSAYPASSDDQLDGILPPVYIYPNPYRVDGGYRDGGWEGRGHPEKINDRVRAIHFVNVPAKCTIRIHTLDGDLVRELHHDVDPSDPKANHATWDMINRNVQMIVSGLYYWSVEDENGKVQIGTLVVLM